MTNPLFFITSKGSPRPWWDRLIPKALPLTPRPWRSWTEKLELTITEKRRMMQKGSWAGLSRYHGHSLVIVNVATEHDYEQSLDYSNIPSQQKFKSERPLSFPLSPPPCIPPSKMRMMVVITAEDLTGDVHLEPDVRSRVRPTRLRAPRRSRVVTVRYTNSGTKVARWSSCCARSPFGMMLVWCCIV